jgi:integrase
VSRHQGQSRTGEIKRTQGGWAIRFRDGRGVRRQRGGFRTKAEAKQVLDDALRKARLGSLYQPDVPLRELVDVFLEQYQGAPASRDWLRYYLVKSTDAFGDVPTGDLDALTIARWRAGMPETMRQGAHRALRQVLAAAVRWRWIDHNVATDVPNPMHARAEFDPFESWEEVGALADELGPYGPLVIFCIGTGVRPEEAFGADWSAVARRGVHGAQGARQGPPEDIHEDRALAASRPAARQGRRRAQRAAGPRGHHVSLGWRRASISTTSARASGCPR